MKLYAINAGMFKLDGGAMFGVVPKSIWQRINPADENNMCTWAMRCLLIEDNDRKILIDTGIGDKQDELFFRHYYLHGDYPVTVSLKKAGFSPEDITDVFFTHLHFDHCGGAVRWADRENKVPELVFPNATYWTNEDHWQWANHPNGREKASFLKENMQPILDSGKLKFVPLNGKSPFSQFDIMFVDGHTDKQMIPVIRYKGRTIVYMADFIPSTGHIALPYIMSYDTRPLLSMEEKIDFLKKAVDKQYILFMEHDRINECCTLKMTGKGPRLDQTFPLSEV